MKNWDAVNAYMEMKKREKRVDHDIGMCLLSSAAKHRIGYEEELPASLAGLEVAKGEEFAFQILIESDAPYFCLLESTKDLHWKGLEDRFRVSLNCEDTVSDFFELQFLGYVTDDDGSLVADPIRTEKSMWVERRYQSLWVAGKIPETFNGSEINISVEVRHTYGYEKERIILSQPLKIQVMDYVIRSVAEGDFYLDLWQHPCSWARAYHVPYYSEAHFQIIENYVCAMAELGQRVINLNVSDYPWGGQSCFMETENPSSLYEYNMVPVYKTSEGKFRCDFSALDRYVAVCMENGVKDEVNIFGILGNWNAYSFGNPLEDYDDPIRVSYYDEADGNYDYIRTKAELREYLSLVLAHIADLGIWEKVKVICDEPNDLELFETCMAFIESTIPELEVKYKCAVHDAEFLREYGDRIPHLSVNTTLAVENALQIESMKEKLEILGGTFTWYSCCFPRQLNIFLASPLIESRLIGWFTYYWNFHGFLRWAYAIWTADPNEDVRFKFPLWAAGDMLYVYPGSDMKPMHSIREKNMLFGIQDFDVFRALEKAGVDSTTLREGMQSLLGKNEDMKSDADRNVQMEHSLDYKSYMDFRNHLIRKHLVQAK